MIDPEYAVAHAELALAILLLVEHVDLDKDDAIAQAELHTVRALALDASRAEGFAAAGLLLSLEGGRGNEAIDQFEKAVELDPNYSDAHNWLGLEYRYLGPAYLNEAFVTLEKAVRLDPLSSRSMANYIV